MRTKAVTPVEYKVGVSQQSLNFDRLLFYDSLFRIKIVFNYIYRLYLERKKKLGFD